MDDEAQRELQHRLDERAEDLVEGSLGLARLAVGGALRTARWSVGTSLAIAERVVGALAEGESVSVAAGQAANDARHALLELAGVEDGAAGDDDGQPPAGRAERSNDPTELRRRGAALLRRSADVDHETTVHPSFGRILDELSPDEARVLRLLAEAGAQPSVDVRTVSPVPNQSRLVAGGLTMIGALAGCRYVDRVPGYLDNLHRLGLVWFSREELDDDQAYQVLEAQPVVVDAMASVRRARTVRRSIQLTAFGTEFVTTCLLDPPPA